MDEPTPQSEVDDDNQFVLDEYDSESDERKPPTGTAGVDGLSAGTLALLERFKGQLSTQQSPEEEDDSVKIFYCSRTHSQLSQFAGELRRVAFPSSIPNDLGADGPDDLSKLEERIKHLSLGSRKNLCINPKVRALENSTAINERCLDLQQSGVAADKKCPYLPTKDDEALALQFRDHTLATVKDIEDIGQVGKKIGICPYYASRSVIKHSEVSVGGISLLHFGCLPTNAVDCDPAISVVTPEIGSGGPRPVDQEPRGHHRRGPQPHGCNCRYPLGDRVIISATDCNRAAHNICP